MSDPPLLHYRSSGTADAPQTTAALTVSFVIGVLPGGFVSAFAYYRFQPQLYDSLIILMGCTLALTVYGSCSAAVGLTLVRKRWRVNERFGYWAMWIAGMFYGSLPAIAFTFSDWGLENQLSRASLWTFISVGPLGFPAILSWIRRKWV